MNTFATNLIRKHAVRFKTGIERVSERRSQWDTLADRANIIMRVAADEAKAQNLFENLYVLDSRETSELTNKLPSIQLSFGQHPLGYNEFKKNVFVMESGCSLTIGQVVGGQVICTLYPFSSVLASRNEKYIIVKIASSPDDLQEKNIRGLVAHLFSYAQVSSVYGAPCLSDWLQVYWLKVKHWWLHFRVSKVALNLLDKVTGAVIDNGSA